MPKLEPKKNWTITADAFENLLKWLDNGKYSDGQNYLEMRQRLVAYFDRKNCINADELADETLNRLARRLQEEGKIESETPAKYCYIVAKFVFMESLRTVQNVSLDDVLLSKKIAVSEQSEEKKIRERMLDCLENCTEKLEPEKHRIIISYYYGEERVKIENRRVLAESLGVSVNALAIRACRIRNKLEDCVKKCVSEEVE